MAGERRGNQPPQGVDLLNDVFGEFDQSVQADLGQAVSDAEELASGRRKKRDAVSQVYEGFENFQAGSHTAINDIESLVQWIEHGIKEMGENLEEPFEISETVKTSLAQLKQIEAEYNRRYELVKNDPHRLEVLEASVFKNQGRQKLIDQTIETLRELGQQVYGKLELSTNTEYVSAFRETTAAKEVFEAYPDLATAYEAAPDTLPNARESFQKRLYDRFAQQHDLHSIKPQWVLFGQQASSGGRWKVASWDFFNELDANKYAEKRRKCITGAARFVTDISLARIEKNVLSGTSASDKRAFFDSDISLRYNNSVVGAPGGLASEQMKNLWLELRRRNILSSAIERKISIGESSDNHLQTLLYGYMLVLRGNVEIDPGGDITRKPGLSSDLNESIPKNISSGGIKEILDVINEHDPELFVHFMALLKISDYDFTSQGGNNLLQNNFQNTGEVFLTQDTIPYRKGREGQDIPAIKSAIERLTDPKNLKEQESGTKILTAEQGVRQANHFQYKLIEELSQRKKLEQTVTAAQIQKEKSLQEAERLGNELRSQGEAVRRLEAETTALKRDIASLKAAADKDAERAKLNTAHLIEQSQSRVRVLRGQLEQIVAGGKTGLLGGSAKIDASHVQGIIDQLK